MTQARVAEVFTIHQLDRNSFFGEGVWGQVRSFGARTSRNRVARVWGKRAITTRPIGILVGLHGLAMSYTLTDWGRIEPIESHSWH
jgi:uncharacterized membrane protein YuzA (DUF378 family)